jgi:hypothetical protein
VTAVQPSLDVQRDCLTGHPMASAVRRSSPVQRLTAQLRHPRWTLSTQLMFYAHSWSWTAGHASQLSRGPALGMQSSIGDVIAGVRWPGCLSEARRVVITRAGPRLPVGRRLGSDLHWSGATRSGTSWALGFTRPIDDRIERAHTPRCPLEPPSPGQASAWG